MNFHQKWLLGGAWGVANDEIWSQEAPKGVQKEAKEPKRGPKDARRGSTDGQRTALGGQKDTQRAPREVFWTQSLSNKWIFMHFWGICDWVKMCGFT